MSDDIKYERSKAIGIAEKKGIKFHPACLAFPLMDEDSFQELVEDIKNKGQQVEVLQDLEGNILDGRNRILACLLLEIEPRYSPVKVNGQGSVADLVVSLNMNRRHLTTTQKSMVAVGLLPIYEAEAKKRQEESGRQSTVKRQLSDNQQSTVSAKLRQPAESTATVLLPQEPKKRGRPPGSKNKSTDQAAKAVGVSGRTVEKTKSVLEKAPDLEEDMKAGILTLEQARALSKYSEEKRKELRKKRAQYNWTTIQTLQAAKMDEEGVSYDPVTLNRIDKGPDLSQLSKEVLEEREKKRNEKQKRAREISQEERERRDSIYADLMRVNKDLFVIGDQLVAQDLRDNWTELGASLKRTILFWASVHNKLYPNDMVNVTNMRSERLL